MPPKSIVTVIEEQFPELSETEAKQLLVRVMNWLTTIGVTCTKELTKACANGEMTKEALLERRAQAVALGVLSKTVAIKFTDEEAQVNAVSEFFYAITGSENVS